MVQNRHAGDRVRVDFHCRVIFTRVNIIEVIYERSGVNVKIKRAFTLTFTRDLPYIASILFTHVEFTCIRT